MSSGRVTAAALVLAMVIAGRATGSVEAPLELVPRQLAEVQRSASRVNAEAGRPTVALVLGGGGLRGFAHVGVLRALEEAGIQPDLVVGTSAGTVVGAAYASGLTSAQIEAAARSVRLTSLVDWTWSLQGLMRGNSLASWIDELTAGIPIERFSVRFAAVATDLNSARAVLLDSGPAGRAVQASAAVPGISVPVPYANGHLVDGAVASLVPVQFARAMGADLVIAVDIYCQDIPSIELGVFAVVRRVVHAQNCAVAAAEMARADVLIAPAIKVSRISAKDEQARAIHDGYEAARVAIAGLALQRKGTEV